MKKSLFIIIALCACTACSKDLPANSENADSEGLKSQFPQKWQLAEMTGSFANSSTTGEDMEWQEFYVLNADQTFTKSRTSDGNITNIFGTYSFSEISDEKYLELNYQIASRIIGSCTSDMQEMMLITSESTMNSTWLACDGPGLRYEKIEL